VGIGTDFWANSVFTHPNNISLVEAEFSLNPIIKLLPAILSLSGAALAIYLYHIQPILLIKFKFNWKENGIRNINYIGIGNIGKSIYTFLNGKYFFDTIYNQYFITNGFKLGYTISKEIDRGAIEFLGPYGLSNYFYNTGKNLAKLDTGIITTYSLYITLGLLALLFLVFAPLFFNNFGNLAFNYNTNAQLYSCPTNSGVYLDEFRLFIIYFASALCVLNQANKKE